MRLEELDTVQEPPPAEKEEEFEIDDEDSSLGESLAEALGHLEDCQGMLEAIADPRLNRRLTVYMLQEVERKAQELEAFLQEYVIVPAERES